MSRDDILNMPVGRELDALVAEKVMGWEVCKLVSRDVCWVYKNSELNIHDGEYFGPSDRISAAWEVVEKIKSPECEVYWFFDHWQAWFGENETAKGSTAPEAICKAALLAVME